MTTSTVEADRYSAISQRLIRQAGEELEKGDFLQAGEKVWGAVAHAAKAVAEQRGWNHNNHRRLHDIADQIADERDRPDLRLLFAAANIMHDNFYEDFLDADRVEQGMLDASFLSESWKRYECCPRRLMSFRAGRRKDACQGLPARPSDPRARSQRESISGRIGGPGGNNAGPIIAATMGRQSSRPVKVGHL